MKKILVFLAIFLMLGTVTWATDPIEDLQQQIDSLAKAREQSIAATKPLEGELARLQAQLKTIEAGIAAAKEQQRQLELSIAKREGDFASQYVLLSERVQSFYKTSRQPSSFFIMFSNNNSGGNWVREIMYQRVVADRDKQAIAQISLDLLQLEKDKKKAEEDRIRLADLQAKADKEAKFFSGEIAGAKAYQAKLSQQIASLTQKQQSIVSQRQAGLNLPTSLGAGPLYCTDDRKLDPGFSGFAFFSYGIPHRVGLNQYGALGRAKIGQGYQDILRAYFDGINFEGGKDSIRIKVSGFGEMGLEEYLLGIYEMPGDWPIEALKAQVVAARSYALAYTNNGQGEICTTQACQVYKGGNKGGQWEQAVRATSGQVMTNGGQVIKAWYSSTDGGYTFSAGDVWGTNKPWTKRTRDTNGGAGSFSELNERAFDKESPCFYSAQGFRNEYGKSAWLKPSEVADIVNVLMLAKADSGAADHLYQTDKPHPYGGELWNEERVKQELRQRNLPVFNNVSSIGVGADFNSGQTTNLTVSGDGGSQSFSGSEFKSYFNLRAPANIQIVGPLYNVEKR